jgi:hypothetical protein
MANTAGVTGQAIPRIDRSRLGYASLRVRFSYPGISRSQKGSNMLTISDSAENILRRELSDLELEIAAEELAMSYTYQTSAYNRCC